MAVSVATGVVTTAGPTSNQLKIDMRDAIAMLDPEESQFTTLLMKLPEEKAKSFKVEWLDDQLLPRLSALSASVGSVSVELLVTASEGEYFRPGDIVRNSVSREAFLVGAVSVDAITVTRSIGTVAAISSVSGAELVIVGHAASQGSRSPLRVITKTAANYNYTQIQRHTFGFTETAEATGFYGGSLVARERRKKGTEHKRALEHMNFFGAREYISTPRSICGGLLEFVTTNIRDASGAFDKGELQDNLRTDLQKGNKNRKALFASPIVGMVLSEFLQDNWVRSDPKLRYFGVKVDYVISAAFGAEVPVFVKREFGDFSTANTQFGGYAFLTDLENVQYAPLRATRLLMNTQDNDEDAVSGEWKTEASLKVEREETHSIWRGVTG